MSIARIALGTSLGLAACAKPAEPATTPAATPREPVAREEPDHGEPEPPPAEIACGNAVCTPPETCISFPTLTATGSAVGHACGVRCDPAQHDADCPSGKRCVPIADGPGPVCR